MAFNFLGTLSIPQLQEFRSFLESQLVDIEEQINYLRAEEFSLKKTIEDFSIADNHFKGNTLDSINSNKYVLPDIIKVTKQDDTPSAAIMSDIKKPFISTIKYKRERLEYKIKKLTDAMEQTKQMIDEKAIARSETVALLNQLEKMFVAENSNFLFVSEEARKNYLQGIVK
jgi:prefoldin subunit 5